MRQHERRLDGVNIFQQRSRKLIGHRPARALLPTVLRRRPTEIACSWPPSTSVYSLYVNTQGVGRRLNLSARPPRSLGRVWDGELC